MAWQIRWTSWCCRTDTGRYTAVSCFKETPKNRLCGSAVTDPEDTGVPGQGQLGPMARSKMKIIEGSVAQVSSLAPDSCTPSQRQFWELCHQVGAGADVDSTAPDKSWAKQRGRISVPARDCRNWAQTAVFLELLGIWDEQNQPWG